MEKIIVVGYPKSGNTWLTRLVGELVNCPISGFLYSDHYEIATEGETRKSDFECYKSHHQLHELKEEDRKDAKIIYVMRDPRDVSISGRKYFYKKLIPIDKDKTPTFLQFPYRVINKIFKSIYGEYRMKKLMNDALLNGNGKVHKWCRIAWDTHVNPYMEDDSILKITYESTLKRPEVECKRIIDFIGVTKTEAEIDQAIQNQSFATVKKKFESNKQTLKANFLRKGKAEQWRSKMSKEEISLFVAKFNKLFKTLDYSTDY